MNTKWTIGKKITCGMIDEMVAWNDQQVAGMQAAARIFATQTKPCLGKVQYYLSHIRDTVTDNMMTDTQMLNREPAILGVAD